MSQPGVESTTPDEESCVPSAPFESMTIAADFEPLAAHFFRTIAGDDGGGALAIYQHGELVLDVWAGSTDRDRPWQQDTMALSYSTSKGVAATVVHRLTDRGLLSYDSPVADYWPEFAAAGKDAITVRTLLNHRAGLHRVRGLVPDTIDAALAEWPDVAAALASSAPDKRRLNAQGYHAVSFGTLVAELVERVTGAPFCDVVRTEIAEPLGEQDFWFRVPTTERHRIAPLSPGVHIAGIPCGIVASTLRALGITGVAEAFPPLIFTAQNHPGVHDLVQPGWNGVFTARALAKMYGAIANRGVIDRQQFLKPDTVATIAQMQHNSRRDYVLGLSMHHWLGYHRVLLPRGSSRRAFGHSGTGGSGGFAFPEIGLSIAFTTNRLGCRATSVIDLRLARFCAHAERIGRTRA